MKEESKCTMCRRAGEKLFLKGDRCHAPKCALIRKPYPPGVHGRKRKRGLSEYGTQLKEKQKVRFSYILSEEQLRNYFEKAALKKGSTAEAFYRAFERRLDNVVFRLGIVKSRSIARQIVSHGHISVNGRKVTIPSYETRIGDRIGISTRSQASGLFGHLEKPKHAKDLSLPDWLRWDHSVKEGKVQALPSFDEGSLPFNLQHIIEFYSR